MKICRNCGTANVSSGQTCYKCLASLAGAEEAAKTTICGNCSSANALGARFCYNCGQSLKSVTHFCNSCGAVNRPEDVYCLDCGRKIMLDNPVEPRPAENRPAENRPAEPHPTVVVTETPALRSNMPAAQAQHPQTAAPVYTPPETLPATRAVMPPAVVQPSSPPQTKQQYRIQLFLMFAALCGALYLFTQTFFTADGLEVSGLAALLVLPYIFIPEIISGVVPAGEFFDIPKLTAELVANSLTQNFAGIFAYLLFGIIVITALALVLSTLIAFIRLIANKPYNNTRKGWFYLCIANLVMAGLELLALNVEIVKKIFLGEGTFGIFEPQMFFYIFAGALFVLFILSRIARVKSPKITKRQKRKAEKKAARKAEKEILKKAK